MEFVIADDVRYLKDFEVWVYAVKRAAAGGAYVPT